MTRIVVVGHVDHGKSTLIGRMLHDTGNIAEGKISALEKACNRRGLEQIEWAFLLDSFQSERDEAMTIDTTQAYLNTAEGHYALIDAPGHQELIRHMMTGTAQADAALLVVDAAQGLQGQTRRHIQILKMMGLRQLGVVINKMDAVNYSSGVFEQISQQVREYLMDSGFTARFIVPVSARAGEMIVSHSKIMSWYQGRTLLEAIATFTPVNRKNKPLRFIVQDVCRHDGRRVIVGRVESGIITQGQEIVFAPFHQRARVETIEIWPADNQKARAHAGETIGITLDQNIIVERGHVASDFKDSPARTTDCKIRIYPLAERDWRSNRNLSVRAGLQNIAAELRYFKMMDDGFIEMNIRLKTPLVFDTEDQVIVCEKNNPVGVGKITESKNRMAVLPGSHQSGVFWLTGLPGAGKTTLAFAADKALQEKGWRVTVLDGDLVRESLSADLDFSVKDRLENMRRVVDRAATYTMDGEVVIVALISPFRAGRNKARATIESHAAFHEVHVKADLSVCEARDPKGLYKRARAGEIRDFTGVDSPYEAPERPDLVIDTENHDVEDCVLKLIAFMEEKAAFYPSESMKDKSIAIG